MSDTIPRGIKITDFPVADHVAPDDFIPILDSSTGIMQRATTDHATEDSSWGLGTEEKYGHVKAIDNFTQAEFAPGEALSAHSGYEFSKNLGSVELDDIAVNAHAKNEYFMFKGRLVRTLEDIPEGGRIQIGTNANFDTVGNALKDLDTQIGEHVLQVDIVVRNGEYGYINNEGQFVGFRSQADIDAAVAAAMQGDVTAAEVLSGKTFTNSSASGLVGTMPNRGKVTPSGLNCGASYTIPDGYHNGQGVVTANSLSSQTGVDSGKSAVTAGTMVSGYQGWVNGNKITGTFAGQEKTVTGSRSAQTVTPDSGKYLSKVTVNKFPDATGTFNCRFNVGRDDMGADNNYRYVFTEEAGRCGAVIRSNFATLLGTVTSDRENFDIKTKYPDKYSQFTIRNFYYEIDKIYLDTDGHFMNSPAQFSYSGNPYGQAIVGSVNGTSTPSFSYNSSTGVLSVSNLKLTERADVTCKVSDNTTVLQSATEQFSIYANVSLKVYIIPYAG